MAGLDLLKVYQSYQNGRKEARQNRLADLDELGQSLQGQVLAGDKTKLAELARVSPERFAAAKQFTDSEKRQFVTDFTRAAYGAKTPEAWKSLVARYEADGHQFDDWEKDPANREAVIAQGLDLGDQMGLDLRREQSAAEASRWQQQFAADQNYKGEQLDIARKELALKEGQEPGLTDDIKEYRYYVSQAKAAGQQPLPFNDWMTDMKRASASQVTVGGGSDKQIFDALAESAATARAAVNGLAGIREAKKAIAGGVITGAYADERLALQKVGALIGAADPSTIVNTETFRSAIAPQVSAMLKATVGTANISNSDREFAEKAAGGSISLDGKSITRLLDIMERAGTAAVKGHIDRLNAVYPEDEKGSFKRERAIFGVNVPAADAGQAQTGKTRRGISFEVGE